MKKIKKNFKYHFEFIHTYKSFAEFATTEANSIIEAQRYAEKEFNRGDHLPYFFVKTIEKLTVL